MITEERLKEIEERPSYEFIAHSRQDIPDLIAEIRRLREALGFYASREIYLFRYDTCEEILKDHGEVARKELGIKE